MNKTADSLYVSVAGCDTNSGTREQPLATLKAARDRVRTLLREQPERDITVWITGGTYRLSETVVFGLADSAAPGRTVTYAALPGETPLLSSGVPITGWRKLEQHPDELPAVARGRIWVAPIPAGLGNFKALYDGDVRLPRARAAGFAPAVEYEAFTNPGEDTLFTLPFPPGAMREYGNLADAELVIRPNYQWVLNILPLAEVDEKAGIARTGTRATYPMGQLHWAHDASRSAWVENVLEGLDTPGKWMVDTRAGLVYLWPRADAPGNGIVAPALTEYIRVEGEIDYDGPEDKPVRGLTFRGLTFTHGDRFTWEKERTGWGLQHDWEMFDRPTALLRFRGAEDCAVEECRFVNSAGAAVRLDLHCMHNRIARNLVGHVGGTGVLLAGYGPGTKDVNRDNEVTDNLIHHVGEDLWHALGIFAWQSGGNRIAHNLIHNVPYTGIAVTGRIGLDRKGQAECSKTVRWQEIDRLLGEAADLRDWQVREPLLHGRNNFIEFNDIHHVAERLGDCNGIYISGTGAGNTVRNNYLHDIPSSNFAEGIRCDDDQFQTLIENNVVFRCGGFATAYCSKGDNVFINNIAACPLPTATERGLISLEPPGPHNGSVFRRNILYATSPQHRAYYQSETRYDLSDPVIHDAVLENNIYFNTAAPEWIKAHLDAQKNLGNEQGSVIADPMFVDPENGDFTLRDNFPALRAGFRPIDLSQVGPRTSSDSPPQPLDTRDTEWFARCGWGVFCHYLTSPQTTVDEWNRQVESFDVEALAGQLAGVGARYLFITLGQNSGHYCAPNATYDRYAGVSPSKCSKRDLVSDLYAALQPRGIELMAYVPAHAPASDHEARKGLRMTTNWDDDPKHNWDSGPHWKTYRLPESQRIWEEVCRDWSLRFGRKVRGWWVDGAYAPAERYPEDQEPNYRSYAAALRAGNPDALVAFNTGVHVPVLSATPHEDFTAGELAGDLAFGGFGLGNNPAWSNFGPINPFVGNARLHVLCFLGEWWGAAPPRFPTELVAGYTRYVNQHGGVVTWDVPISKDGRIPAEFCAQLSAIAG